MVAVTKEEFEKLVNDLVSEVEWFANCIIERQYGDAGDAASTLDGMWQAIKAESSRWEIG